MKMKFLLALTLMVSATAFANNDRYIKCWDTAQEDGGRPAYVFKAEYDMEAVNRDLHLIYPFDFELHNYHGCLVGGYPSETAEMNNGKFKICPTQGQSINGLIPFEVEERFFEGTVYCEKGLKRYFYDHDDN